MAWIAAAPAPADDELPRKPSLGAAISPGEGGPKVDRVLPGTSAEAAGLEPGDVILALDGEATADPAAVIGRIAPKRVGDEIALTLRRDGRTFEQAVTLKERPREAGDGYAVEYGSVESRGARLRTIVTRPEGAEGRLPAVLLIQGLGCFSVENPPGGTMPYIPILAGLTKAGILTMRVEKPGMGDSTGGPCSEIDFETELDGYRRALLALKARPDVDPDNVYIFGHSMGGIMGPLIAREIPVRGIAVYGTALKSWTEYLLENTRRQMLLGGETHAAVDAYNRRNLQFMHHFAVEKKSPEAIAREYPDLADLVRDQYADGTHAFGVHYTFFQQLHDQRLPEAWEGVGDARVLAVHGHADYVSGADDHAAIAAIVNRVRDGHGRYVELPDSNHGFDRYESEEAALAGFGRPSEPNPAFGELLRDWVLETVDKHQG
jgi:pimeloyl-ACP methyl ester carboxylesterase